MNGMKNCSRAQSLSFCLFLIVALLLGIGLGGCQERGSGVAAKIKSSTEEYTWEELSSISNELSECSSEAEALGLAVEYHLANEDGALDGTQAKALTLDNGAVVSAQIAGFWHDDKQSGGKAGITFIVDSSIAVHSMNLSNTSSGGWKDSELRKWMNSEGMELLPAELKDVLVAVDKKTNNIGIASDASCISSTDDKLWAFSLVELCGDTLDVATSDDLRFLNDIYMAEGRQYKLFQDSSVGLALSNDILIKSYDDAVLPWWGRSANPVNEGYFSGVYVDGCPGYGWAAAESIGVVFGFCV